MPFGKEALHSRKIGGKLFGNKKGFPSLIEGVLQESPILVPLPYESHVVSLVEGFTLWLARYLNGEVKTYLNKNIMKHNDK